MNAPLSAQASSTSHRSLEIEYVAERYHRAFDEEGSTLAALLSHTRDRSVVGTFAQLRAQLQVHDQLQERVLFPAYEQGQPPDKRALHLWIQDSDALSKEVAKMRELAATLAFAPLRQRLMHFLFELDRHLVDEMQLLASWAGAQEATGSP